jgi:hypothetical protein
MPQGSKGAKRPRDPAQPAKLIVDIATGEPTPEEQGKDPGAVALGRKGGTARAAALGGRKRAISRASRPPQLLLKPAPVRSTALI